MRGKLEDDLVRIRRDPAGRNVQQHRHHERDLHVDDAAGTLAFLARR